MSQITYNRPQVKGKVCVCVPSYNHSRYIKDNLEAIFAQTYRPMELIVIDDGSTDDSPQIIKKTLENCPFDNKFIVRPNKGLPATINEGLEMSDGEFFAVIASDDMWLPSFVESRVKQLQKRPDAVLAYGNCYIIDNENNIIGITSDWAEYDDGNARDMLLTRFPPSSPSVIFRSAALNVHKWNPTAKVEDFELYLRLSTLGDFAFDPAPRSAWRAHDYNMSKKTLTMMEATLSALESNSELLQLTNEEKKHFIENVKWSSIESFLQAGKRTEALKQAIFSIGFKKPFSSKVKIFLKLIIPFNLIRTKRKLKWNKYQSNSLRNIKEMM
jgi:alpha-1,3-rhamnosyltransferase